MPCEGFPGRETGPSRFQQRWLVLAAAHSIIKLDELAAAQQRSH